MSQDHIGDHGDRRLDEGRADGQKPNLAFCLDIHGRLTLGDAASSAPMAERSGATPGCSIGSTGGPPAGCARTASQLQTSKVRPCPAGA